MAIKLCDSTTFFFVNFFSFPFHLISAGKATTDEELEEMLESGNAAVFTAGVSVPILELCTNTLIVIQMN